MNLEKINALFTRYLEQTYHQRIHGTTGQKPIDRYLADVKALRKAPDNLPEFFRRQEIRKVNNDRTVQLMGRLYEAPVGLVGMKVILRYEDPDRIEVFLDEKSMGFLKDLNQEVNSRIKRDSPPQASTTVSGGQLFERATGAR
jgi:putative transposase